MAEKSEAAAIPANLMRTMPYTAYVAVGSYATIFWSGSAAWLFSALVVGEVFNAGAKSLLKKLAGPKAELLRRPDGAADSGIYPQHFPRASLSSGMPSGHSQTSAFLATVLSRYLLAQRGLDGVPWQRCPDRLGSCAGSLQAEPELVVPLCYIWTLAAMVIVSRTRFAGPLAVRVDGLAVAHHTVLQVIVGAAVGCLLGNAAFEWHAGGEWLPFLGSVAIVLGGVAMVAGVEARCTGAFDGSGSDQEPSSDSDKSRDAWGSSASTDVGSPSEVELQSRTASRTSSLPGSASARTH